MLIAMKDANALGGKVYIHGQIVFEGTPTACARRPTSAATGSRSIDPHSILTSMV